MGKRRSVCCCCRFYFPDVIRVRAFGLAVILRATLSRKGVTDGGAVLIARLLVPDRPTWGALRVDPSFSIGGRAGSSWFRERKRVRRVPFCRRVVRWKWYAVQDRRVFTRRASNEAMKDRR